MIVNTDNHFRDISKFTKIQLSRESENDVRKFWDIMSRYLFHTPRKLDIMLFLLTLQGIYHQETLMFSRELFNLAENHTSDIFQPLAIF